MILFLLALVCIAISVAVVVMEKTYYYLPERELKRQAAQHDPLASVLWRAVAYGSLLRILLWTLLGVSAAVGFVLFASVAPTVLAMVAVGLLLLVTFAWLPNTRLTHFGGRLTVAATPAVVWLLERLSPLLRMVHRQASPHARASHTGLYQRDDLLELIEQQKSQPDNRISEEELDMAKAALSFGQRKVSEALVPRAKVRAVAANEEVGPILLDELHQSLHRRFPVHAANNNDDIVGTLCLQDLVKVNQGTGAKGRVQDLMEKDVAFVHENDSLAEALHSFYQTKCQLFVVINSFNEYVGIITLEDILRQLVGQPTIQPLEKAAGRHEVAARHQKKEKEESEQAVEEKTDDLIIEPAAD